MTATLEHVMADHEAKMQQEYYAQTAETYDQMHVGSDAEHDFAMAVFISDANNFGQGSPIARCVKQTIRALGLWSVADWIKTGGKGYKISEEDGLAYSYSTFDSYPQVRRACRDVHIVNTRNGSGVNPYRTASHVALLGIK